MAQVKDRSNISARLAAISILQIAAMHESLDESSRRMQHSSSGDSYDRWLNESYLSEELCLAILDSLGALSRGLGGPHTM